MRWFGLTLLLASAAADAPSKNVNGTVVSKAPVDVKSEVNGTLVSKGPVDVKKEVSNATAGVGTSLRKALAVPKVPQKDVMTEVTFSTRMMPTMCVFLVFLALYTSSWLQAPDDESEGERYELLNPHSQPQRVWLRPSDESKKLFLLSATVIASHTLSSINCEQVFRADGFRFGYFYAMVQFIMNAISPIVVRFNSQGWAGVTALFPSGENGLLKEMAMCGFSMALSHGTGLECLVFLNFTTTLIFKSAKVPTVMLGSLFINDMKYSRYEYICSAVMMLGLILFGMGDSIGSLKFHPFGIALVVMSLMAGSVSSNLQQKVLQSGAMEDKDALRDRLFVILYVFGAISLLPVCLATDEFGSAMAWLVKAPLTSGFIPIFLDGMLGYVGIQAVLKLSQDFDATRANVACSMRRVVTFILSFTVFPKPFGVLHAVGIALSLFGGLELHKSHKPKGSKNKGKSDSRL